MSFEHVSAITDRFVSILSKDTYDTFYFDKHVDLHLNYYILNYSNNYLGKLIFYVCGRDILGNSCFCLGIYLYKHDKQIHN